MKAALLFGLDIRHSGSLMPHDYGNPWLAWLRAWLFFSGATNWSWRCAWHQNKGDTRRLIGVFKICDCNYFFIYYLGLFWGFFSSSYWRWTLLKIRQLVAKGRSKVRVYSHRTGIPHECCSHPARKACQDQRPARFRLNLQFEIYLQREVSCRHVLPVVHLLSISATNANTASLPY